MNKSEVSKDGQIIMVTYVDHILPREYLHCNNMYNQPYNLRAQIPIEVVTITEKLEEMVVGSKTMMNAKKIYDIQPEIVWDNNL